MVWFLSRFSGFFRSSLHFRAGGAPAHAIVLSIVFLAKGAEAYPDFIGYGYTSCVTCHYNTQGNGPLNDYGRALFAGEIAARDVFPDTTTDDDLGAASGFLGKKELPWWLRPSAKTRSLWLNTNPGLASNGTTWTYYDMQEDLNLTVLIDHDQKYVVQLGLSRFPSNNGFAANGTSGDPEIWYSRENYLRVQATKHLWISAGMLEKVYGLRLIDHTAFSRQGIGIVNYEVLHGSLTHGMVVQYNQTEYELTGNYFIGNLNETTDADQNAKQKGFSLMFEYNVGEKSRAGISILSSSSSAIQESRIAVHDKLGLSLGSSLLTELGYFKDAASSTSTTNSGFYGLIQNSTLLRRGYSLLSLAEYYASSLNAPSGTTDNGTNFRWGLGFLTFPLPRVEFRFAARDLRLWRNDQGNKDSWDLQAQLHLSL